MSGPDPADALGRLIANAPPGAEPCPDDGALAAWAEDRLDEGRRDAVEAHLSTCDECRRTATDLRTVVAEEAPRAAAPAGAPTPSLEAARARRVRPGAWALAAAVLVAVGAGVAVATMRAGRGSSEGEGAPGTDARLVAAARDLREHAPDLFAGFEPAGAAERRSVVPDVLRGDVRVLRPAGTVLEERPRLAWSGGDGEAYDVTLSGPDGTDLWRRRVTGRETAFPADAPALVAGTAYVVTVAPVSDGGPATRGFRTASTAERAAWERVAAAVEARAPADLRALLLAHAAARRGLLLEAEARAGEAVAAGATAVAEETRAWVRARLGVPAPGTGR